MIQPRRTGQRVRVPVVVTVLLLWAAAGRRGRPQPPWAIELDTCPPHGCAEPDIDWQIAHGDSFHNDRFPDLKAEYVVANLAFNMRDWRGKLLKDDKRW